MKAKVKELDRRYLRASEAHLRSTSIDVTKVSCWCGGSTREMRAPLRLCVGDRLQITCEDGHEVILKIGLT